MGWKFEDKKNFTVLSLKSAVLSLSEFQRRVNDHNNGCFVALRPH